MMQQLCQTIVPEHGNAKLKFITFKIKVKDISGSLKVTDIMFQGGSTGTRWIGHPSEIKWSFDNE